MPPLSALVLSAYAEEPRINVEKSLELLLSSTREIPDSVPGELRGIAFTVPVKLGKQDAIDYLLQLQQTTSSSEIKGEICGALTATRDKDQASKLHSRA